MRHIDFYRNLVLDGFIQHPFWFALKIVKSMFLVETKHGMR